MNKLELGSETHIDKNNGIFNLNKPTDKVKRAFDECTQLALKEYGAPTISRSIKINFREVGINNYIPSKAEINLPKQVLEAGKEYRLFTELAHEIAHALLRADADHPAATKLEEGLATRLFMQMRRQKRYVDVYHSTFTLSASATGDYTNAYRLVCETLDHDKDIIRDIRLSTPLITSFDRQMFIDKGVLPALADALCAPFW